MSTPPLLSLDALQLAEALGGPGRAKTIFGLLRRGEDPFTWHGMGRRAAERLRAVSQPTSIEPVFQTVASDGTLKARLRLGDMASDEAVESVLIPTVRRTTLCVSSQVGCARGCVFCLTGTMGLRKNLTPDQILAQVSWGLAEARSRALPPLRNVVFMGMGEPLDNAAAVHSTVSRLTAASGWGFSPRHVTVSTVGPSVEAIRKLAAMPAQLAWSVHAGREEVRRKLIPTARQPVEALRDAFAEILLSRGDSLFAEVTLLDGVNDRVEDAIAMATLLRPLPGETRVNLLPMNPIGNALGGSGEGRVSAFADCLREHGLFCTVRAGRGADRGAACGQLSVGARKTRSVPAKPEVTGEGRET